MFDVVVVGCGLTGSVIARYLAEKRNLRVEIWERRNHIGGNMYDYCDSHGILVHKYGPHIFHTNSSEVYEYVCRFTQWHEFRLSCRAEIDGIATPSPFNFQTIDDLYPKQEAEKLKQHLLTVFGGRKTATILEVLEHPDHMIRSYAQLLFEKDYSIYTAKQWGVPPSDIDPSVLRRVPLRFSYNDGYFDDRYQVMPVGGYTKFIKELLAHPNIKVKLNTDALQHLTITQDGKGLLLDGELTKAPVVFSGALDELFDCSEGRLPYRSLHFEWKYEDIDSFQSAPVVAYPQAVGYTRITEYKKLPVQNVRGTSYAVEYPIPYSQERMGEPYYPVLTKDSQMLYEVYRRKAERIPNLICCGRLADFQYYNMDQAIERALKTGEQIT